LASDLAVECSPASGSQFAIGTTTVTCLSSDAAGNTSSTSFDVIVSVDTNPIIGDPGDQTVTLTAGSSGPVTYTEPVPTGTAAGAVTIVCDPPSGSTFNAGTTTITCTGTDDTGKVSTTTFDLTVVAASIGPGSLPETGSSNLIPIQLASLLLLAGLALRTIPSRRRITIGVRPHR
jgi:hypothetical protein